MAGGPRSSAPSLPHITRRRWRCCQQQRAGASTEPGASRSERYWHRCYCQRAATVNRHRPQEQPCLEGALHVEPAAHTPADCAWTRLCRCPPRCSGHQAHHVSGRGRGGRRGGGGGGCGEPSADAAAAEARHALLGRLQSPERRRARARRRCRHRRALPDPDAPPVPTDAPRPSCKCVPPAHGYPVGLRVAPAPRPCHGGARLRGDSACELEALQQMGRSSSPSTHSPSPRSSTSPPPSTQWLPPLHRQSSSSASTQLDAVLSDPDAFYRAYLINRAQWRGQRRALGAVAELAPRTMHHIGPCSPLAGSPAADSGALGTCGAPDAAACYCSSAEGGPGLCAAPGTPGGPATCDASFLACNASCGTALVAAGNCAASVYSYSCACRCGGSCGSGGRAAYKTPFHFAAPLTARSRRRPSITRRCARTAWAASPRLSRSAPRTIALSLSCSRSGPPPSQPSRSSPARTCSPARTRRSRCAPASRARPCASRERSIPSVPTRPSGTGRCAAWGSGQ